jgi:RHS repeat-associated protein
MVAINTKFLATNCTLLRRGFGGQANGHEFGKLLNSQGPLADENPFRFSSEYFASETGLVYYNFRYYSPELGRWLSRDPHYEIGSISWLTDIKVKLEQEATKIKMIDACVDVIKKLFPRHQFFAITKLINLLTTKKLQIKFHINSLLTGTVEAYNPYLFCSNESNNVFDELGLGDIESVQDAFKEED